MSPRTSGTRGRHGGRERRSKGCRERRRSRRGRQFQHHVGADVSGSARHQNRHAAPASFLVAGTDAAEPLRLSLNFRAKASRSIGVAPQNRPRSRLACQLRRLRTIAPSHRPSSAHRAEPSMTKRIRKAVFPVAGLGTRFLPATKAIPKEMLTVVDRPVIQHVVDEARAAGIEHFVFVTGRDKAVIEDHFDINFELERTLAERGKTRELEALQARPARRRRRPASRASRRRWASAMRSGARATSSATSPSRCCCRTCCTSAASPALPGMIDGLRAATAATSSPSYEVPDERDAPVRHRRRRDGRTAARCGSPRWSRSRPRARRRRTSHISGRYILQPEIFEILETQERGAGGEIQLTDAMITLAQAPALLRAYASTARSTTPARSSASSWPTSPMRCSARISGRRSGSSWTSCWGA